jgi:MFS family permease
MGFSPLESGIGLLPMLGTYAVVSFLVGALAGRLSDRIAIIAGLAGLAAGQFLISVFGVAAGYAGLAAGLALMGIGLGLFMPTSSTVAVQADDRGRKSLALGLTQMFQFVGGAIGLGLTTTIVASSERAAVNNHLADLRTVLTTPERSALDSLLAGSESARQVLQQFDPAAAQQLLDIAGDAFAAGVQSGLRLDAAIATLALLLAVLLLGKIKGETRHT